MTTRFFPLVLAAVLAACAGNSAESDMRSTANPSAVITAELAFARAAQEKGQWAAFRDYATADAVMFVPQRTTARAWLRGRAEPPVPVQWQPSEVWVSCDGSYGVTRGPWTRPDSVGDLTTVWQRQRNGEYKWVLDQGDALAEPMAAREMIAAHVADCSEPPAAPIPAASEGVDRAVGKSEDGTLQWVSDVKPDGSRSFNVQMWTGSAFEQVVFSQVGAGN